METAIEVSGARRRAWQPLRPMSDAALARTAASGSRAALAAIFERHHQALYRYCRSLLGNDADAEDALQNAMTRVVRSLPGEQRDIALRPWLYRIAHNEALRLFGARRPHASLDDVGALAAPDGAERDAARERVAGLARDLRALPERQRATVILRELNGLAFEEIGASLGISAAAAKQSAYEARMALQEFEQGRAMRCEEIARALSDRDRRRLKGRRVRAHLRECSDCRAFRAAIERRSEQVRALAPPLAAPAAAAILAETVGGGSAGGGGVLALLGSGAAKVAAPAAAVKAAGTVALVAAAGAGISAAGDHDRAAAERSTSPAALRAVPAPAAGQAPPEPLRPAGRGGDGRPQSRRARADRPGAAPERDAAHRRRLRPSERGVRAESPAGAGSEHHERAPDVVGPQSDRRPRPPAGTPAPEHDRPVGTTERTPPASPSPPPAAPPEPMAPPPAQPVPSPETADAAPPRPAAAPAQPAPPVEPGSAPDGPPGG